MNVLADRDVPDHPRCCEVNDTGIPSRNSSRSSFVCHPPDGMSQALQYIT
jgi:hypothetical protein